MRNTILALLLGFTAVGLTGCQSMLSHIHIYDIQQGNVVTKAMADKLRIGMSTDQVRAILGDPVITNTFRLNRWDYVYTMKKPYHPRDEKVLTVYFNNNGILNKIVKHKKDN